MEIGNLQLGMAVVLVATVQTIQAPPGSDPSRHSAYLRLSDGQAVQTNVRNFEPYVTPVDPVAEVETGAVSVVRDELERSLASEKAEHEATAKLLAGVEAERDEWRTKAAQAEAAAQEIGLVLKEREAELEKLRAELSAKAPESLEKPQTGEPTEPAKRGGR